MAPSTEGVGDRWGKADMGWVATEGRKWQEGADEPSTHIHACPYTHAHNPVNILKHK